jgi:hypothetical protein
MHIEHIGGEVGGLFGVKSLPNKVLPGAHSNSSSPSHPTPNLHHPIRLIPRHSNLMIRSDTMFTCSVDMGPVEGMQLDDVGGTVCRCQGNGPTMST